MQLDAFTKQETPQQVALKQMVDHQSRRLPKIDEEGIRVGVVTESDVLGNVLEFTSGVLIPPPVYQKLRKNRWS